LFEIGDDFSGDAAVKIDAGWCVGCVSAALLDRHGFPLLPGRPPLWGLDAARPERGALATEGRGGGGGSPGLAGRLRLKAGDTPGAGTALAQECRGALQGPRVSRNVAAGWQLGIQAIDVQSDPTI
jgi:hypothetical protein